MMHLVAFGWDGISRKAIVAFINNSGMLIVLFGVVLLGCSSSARQRTDLSDERRTEAVINSVISEARFTSLGQAIVTYNAIKKVFSLWNAETMKFEKTIHLQDTKVGSIAVDASEPIVAYSSGKVVWIRDFEGIRGSFIVDDSGEIVHRIILDRRTNFISCVTNKDRLYIWDYSDSQSVRIVSNILGSRIFKYIGNNNQLITGGRKITFWNIENGKENRSILNGVLLGMRDAAYSDDGNWLAVITDRGEVAVWKEEDRIIQTTFNLPIEHSQSAEIMIDSNMGRIVTLGASFDGNGSHLSSWNIIDGKLIVERELKRRFEHVDITSDGRKLLLSGNGCDAELREMDELKLLLTIGNECDLNSIQGGI